MKTIYEHLIAEKESCERIARRLRAELNAHGPSMHIEHDIEHWERMAKALEIAAKNLPVEVAEQEI